MNRDEKDYLFVFILIAIIFLLASLADTCYGQEFLQWRWSHEPILKNPDASGLHCIGSAYLAGTFENTMKWWQADLLAFGLGLAWEIKDGLMPCEKVGIIGGEGFSVNDLLFLVAGIFLVRYFLWIVGALCILIGVWLMADDLWQHWRQRFDAHYTSPVHRLGIPLYRFRTNLIANHPWWKWLERF